jgi:hypothetical protein
MPPFFPLSRVTSLYKIRKGLITSYEAEANGHVTFTSRDFATLTIDGGNPAATAVSDNSSAARVRRVLMNQTLGDALQINGPIGEDLWKDASEVIIEKNEASDEAIQMNYAVPDDVFREILRVRQPALRDAVVEVD